MATLYRCHDAVVVRAAAHSLTVDWPDPADGSDARLRRWLTQVWASEGVAEAISVASPQLADRVDEYRQGLSDPRRLRRAVTSVAKYLLRMAARPTPFGLFAGVAVASFGAHAQVRWGREHRVTARPDGRWIHHELAALQTHPGLLPRLNVLADNTCAVRGERLVVTHRPLRSGAGPAEVSVRHNRPVQLAMQAARLPTPASNVIRELAAEFPDAPAETIVRMLGGLISLGILHSSLRAPMTNTGPLGHLLEQLTAAGADSIDDLRERVAPLRAIQAAVGVHNQARMAADRQNATAQIRRLVAAGGSGVEQPLMVDLRLDCDIVLPEVIAHEAEQAATLLSRLTPYPNGSPAWQQYHDRFLDRYGPGAVVPVAELVDPVRGLGFPSGYLHPSAESAQPGQPGRDRRLLRLAQRAAIDGAREVVLDEDAVRELAGGAATDVVPHTDLCFELQARSRRALDDGEFRLVVRSASRSAGTTTGRFLDLFGGQVHERLACLLAAVPTVVVGALRAQVSCRPSYQATENVGRAPAVVPSTISLAEWYQAAGAIRLDELAVTADSRRLYLIRLGHNQVVEPFTLTAVDFRHHTHPLARFLCELPTARAAACLPFTWGAADVLPYLPALRYGRTVLAPARWRLAASDLPQPGAGWAQWRSALLRWRERWQVGRRVHLGDGDQRLRLDLDESYHQHLIRIQLNGCDGVTLFEAADEAVLGWCDQRPHEIVLTLTSTRPPAPAPAVSRQASVVQCREELRPPGTSPWLYAKLFAPADWHTVILTNHLADLLAGWGQPLQWWFLRHHDPHPHLRLRLHLPTCGSADYGAAVQRVGGWAKHLLRLGLASRLQFDTDVAEAGRYGTGPAEAAAATVFSADSRATVAQLRLSGSGHLDPSVVAAASFLDLAVAFTGDPIRGAEWLVAEVHPGAAGNPGAGRDARRQVLALTDPATGSDAIRAMSDGEEVLAAWRARADAAAAYRASLDGSGWPEPAVVLPTLLHLHHARMIGLDPASERACLRLARAAALALTARTPAAPR